jgi:hypothetical protein
MKRHLTCLFTLIAIVLAGTLAVAHPHFNKTVIVKLPSGVEATITYNTTPSNEANATKAAVGTFVTPRQPKLKLSAEIKVGDVTIPAGEYIIGCIKNAEDDWTLALYAGTIARGTPPDMTKVIKLPSMFKKGAGEAPHMLIDISPGSGQFEGKAVLTLHFGTLFLAGALS